MNLRDIQQTLGSLRKEGSFTSNASLTFTSRLASILLVLFFTPILARLYSPESYGLLSVFMIFVNLFISIGSFGFLEMMAIEKDKAEFYRLFWISCILYLILSVPFIVTMIWINKLVEFSQYQFSLEYLFIIWLGLISFSLYTLLNKWTIFHNRFKFLSVMNFFGSLTSRATSLIIALSFFTKFGLAVGDISGHVFQNVGFHFNFLRGERKTLIAELKPRRLLVSLRKNIRNTYYFPFINLLQRLSEQLALFAVLSIYDMATLGKYSMAMGLIAIPINLLANSLYSVFIQKFNNTTEPEITVFLGKIVKLIFGILTIPVIVMVIFLPRFLPLFLGNQWVLSGKIAAILSIYISHEILGVCFNSLLHATKRQKTLFLFNGIKLIAIAIGLWVGHQFGDILYLVIGYCGAILFFNFLKIQYILRLFNSKGRILNVVLFTLFVILLLLCSFEVI